MPSVIFLQEVGEFLAVFMATKTDVFDGKFEQFPAICVVNKTRYVWGEIFSHLCGDQNGIC